MKGTQAFLLLMGAFYSAAGLLTVRATLHDAWCDAALGALGGGPQMRASVERTWWIVTGGLLVAAGGALLLALSVWAVVPFVISAASQATYVWVLAPRRFDPVDPPTPEGRRQTTNAFWFHLSSTLVVLRATWIGALRPLRLATLPAFAGAVLLWSVGTVVAFRQLVRIARIEAPADADSDAVVARSELPEPAELDDE